MRPRRRAGADWLLGEIATELREGGFDTLVNNAGAPQPALSGPGMAPASPETARRTDAPARVIVPELVAECPRRQSAALVERCGYRLDTLISRHGSADRSQVLLFQIEAAQIIPDARWQLRYEGGRVPWIAVDDHRIDGASLGAKSRS